VYVIRIEVTSRSVGRALVRLAPAAESALAVRRDLTTARAANHTIALATANRMSILAILADLTATVGDSAVLVNVRVDSTGAITLSGFAPSSARVLAELERSPSVGAARFEGPTGRQLLGDPGASAREWDRFGIAARLRSAQ
jgi:hypothetical protein